MKEIRDQSLLRRIRETIERVEAANSLNEVQNIKKISGAGDIYRVRVGDYRIGLAMEGDVAEFVRCLHRRDTYRYFP